MMGKMANLPVVYIEQQIHRKAAINDYLFSFPVDYDTLIFVGTLLR